MADSSRTTQEQFNKLESLIKNGDEATLYNTAPVGFCAFSLTLFVFSMHQAGATISPYVSPALGMGLALFYGGLIELIAGYYELKQGNNLNAMTFFGYAGFWLGLGSMFVTGSFGFQAAVTDTTLTHHSYGVFFLSWTIFTLCMLISSIRTNVMTILFFFFLMVFYVLLTAAYYSNDNIDVRRAGGAIGIFTSVIGWYIGFAKLLVKDENSYFNLPLFAMPGNTRGSEKKPVEVRQ